MSTARTKAPAVPPMHPREKLTRKARAAISKYAALASKGMPYHNVMVDAVLDAERMPRERLYAWLQEHGCYWYSDMGTWVQGGTHKSSEAVQS